jgi:antitoxin (DNA-binding transcriptional repressor) of toxin-antitoxin stability system
MVMQSIEVFSVRDLRLRSSELVRDAEAGQVSIITKRGKPAVLALPFGSRLLNLGVDKDLALALFERRLVTLAKAAKLAGVTQDAFMDLVANAGLVAVDYAPDELTDELRVEI